jgi:hypothetical protein
VATGSLPASGGASAVSARKKMSQPAAPPSHGSQCRSCRVELHRPLLADWPDET